MNSVKEMRSVLAYLGVEYNEQPTKIGELKFVLGQYERLDKDVYDSAIRVVIDGEQEATHTPIILDGDVDVNKIIAELVKDYENKSVKSFADSVTDKLEELDDRSATALIRIMDEHEKKRDALGVELMETFKVEMAKYRKIVIEKPSEGSRKEIEGVLPDEFEDMLHLADMRVNIMMVGPAGAGKTFLAGKVAEALDLPFGSQSCSAGISESVFIGWLLPTGDNGKFNHVTSRFLEIYEGGGVFLLDEMDAADPNVLTFLNQALANGGFYLPQRFGNTYVTKHKDFVAMSACNTFGQGADAMYHARNALDGATLDRFKMGVTVIDYSDQVEENLIEKDVLLWGRTVRASINKRNLNKIMSTRVMIDATKMVRGKGWSIQKIAKKYFQDWSKEEIAIMKSDGVNIGNKDGDESTPKAQQSGSVKRVVSPIQDMPW